MRLRRRLALAAVSVLAASVGAIASCTGSDPPSGSSTSDGADASGNGDGLPDAKVDADGDDGATPALPPLEGAIDVSCGQLHTCAIVGAGDVFCWGDNAFGQLGQPASVSASSLPLAVNLGGGKAREIAAGGYHTCARLADGTVRCWGKNDSGQAGIGQVSAIAPVSPVVLADGGAFDRVAQLSAGFAHSCALQTADGGAIVPFPGGGPAEVSCWGANNFGEVGVNTNTSPRTTPLARDGSISSGTIVAGYEVRAGTSFTCLEGVIPVGVGADVSPMCWGAAAGGQLGTDAGTGTFAATLPDDPPDRAYIQSKGLLVAGASHACIRSTVASGQAFFCWGDNAFGQLGGPDEGILRPNKPMGNVNAANVSAIAAGGAVTCVIESGQVRCAGANGSGQLGAGTVNTTKNATLTNAVLAPQASTLSVGDKHVCAVLGQAKGQPGPVYCWGANAKGQLGDGLDLAAGYSGTTAEERFVRSKPVRVVKPK